MRCFIYLCHVLYIKAMFYIFMSISIHVASLFIYAAPRFPYLLHCLLSFMVYQHKFMLHHHNKSCRFVGPQATAVMVMMMINFLLYG